MSKTNENILTAIIGFATMIGAAVICSKVRKTMKEMDDAMIASLEKDPTLNIVNQNAKVEAYRLIAERYSPTKYDRTLDEIADVEKNDLANLKEDTIRLKDTALKTMAVPDENGDMSSIYDMLVMINDDIINSRVALMGLLASAYEECEDEAPEEEEYDDEYEDDYEDDEEEDDWEADTYQPTCMDPNCDCEDSPRLRLGTPARRAMMINPRKVLSARNSMVDRGDKPFAFNALFNQIEKNEKTEEESSTKPEIERNVNVQYNFDENKLEDGVVISKSFAEKLSTETVEVKTSEDSSDIDVPSENIQEGIELDVKPEITTSLDDIATDTPIEESSETVEETESAEEPSIEDSMKEQIENADGDAEEKKESPGMMFGIKVPKEYIFQNKQSNGLYKLELLNKEISGRYTGMIYWGDDTKEAFDTKDTNSLSHEYKKVKDRIIKVVITNETNSISDKVLNRDMNCTILTSVQLSENALMEMKMIKNN